MSIDESIKQGLVELNLSSLVGPFVKYLQLMQQWNNAYNLTAIRDLETMVTRHLMDSLAILPWITGTYLLDVGTGPGLPGIPLALARPDLQVVLLDSNGKKTRFLREVVRELSIPNVQVVQSRVEEYRSRQLFDTIVSRAFTHLKQMLDWSAHLVAARGRWVAMKGVYPAVEIEAITKPCYVETYSVAGVVGERCVCIIENNENRSHHG